ncbi:hypothetical protein NWFMUON74_15840 [Nocardia wallacei]|uniref:Uncharacterized protein n=1 Tax=Nocardia wallacei TaxID=480035 RepID=A0A7G1KEX5_9NOCA|nr:hypothetical protein NWFMUON74_15840 [Nocardia wallacei]
MRIAEIADLPQHDLGEPVELVIVERIHGASLVAGRQPLHRKTFRPWKGVARVSGGRGAPPHINLQFLKYFSLC